MGVEEACFGKFRVAIEEVGECGFGFVEFPGAVEEHGVFEAGGGVGRGEGDGGLEGVESFRAAVDHAEGLAGEGEGGWGVSGCC